MGYEAVNVGGLILSRPKIIIKHAGEIDTTACTYILGYDSLQSKQPLVATQSSTF